MIYSPKKIRGSKVRIMAHLAKNKHRWVPNHELCQPGIGGLRAIARVWELRKMGVPISMRRKGTSGTYLFKIGAIKDD